MAENPTPTPGEYKRDVGSGEQLEMGDATELNKELAAGDAVEEKLVAESVIPASPAPVMPTDQDFNVEYADDEDIFSPTNEDEEILFGPTEGLGGNPQPTRPVPNSVLRALPLLSTIANDPSTPPAIRAAYKMILERLAAENRAQF